MTSRFWRRLKIISFSLFWCFFFVGLVGTWIESLSQERGHLEITLMCLIAVILLASFFMVAGIEIAYTDLRDKDPDQLPPTLKPLLVDMQNHEEVVYEAREWLGVVLIVIFTYISDFDTVYVPFLGPHHWRLLFSLLFTTFPIVWIAQGPAKYFATRNSETFLKRFAIAWPAFRVIGWLLDVLELRRLSRFVYRLLGRVFGGSANRRNLPPSNSAFYVASLKRYGYALHSIKEDITIDDLGGAVLRQTGILHVVAPGRSGFNRAYTFQSPANLNDADVRIVKACWLPQPGERLDDICTQIDPFLLNPLPASLSSVPTGLLDANKSIDPANPNKILFEFSSAFEWPDGPNGNRAFLLMYEIEVRSLATLYNTAAHAIEWHSATFDIPCRRYQADIAMTNRRFAKPEVQVTFKGNPHVMEGRRATGCLRYNELDTLQCLLDYPLPAAKYQIQWEMW